MRASGDRWPSHSLGKYVSLVKRWPEKRSPSLPSIEFSPVYRRQTATTTDEVHGISPTFGAHQHARRGCLYHAMLSEALFWLCREKRQWALRRVMRTEAGSRSVYAKCVFALDGRTRRATVLFRIEFRKTWMPPRSSQNPPSTLCCAMRACRDTRKSAFQSDEPCFLP